jgi:ATP-binding cassette subfamily B protein
MNFLNLYGRVFALLGPEKRTALMLALANVALASLGFLEPILFGRIIDVLTNSVARGSAATWSDSFQLLGLWAALGVGGILASMAVSVIADRLTHRRRLAVMQNYVEHVLSLPLSYHGTTHSGRLIKIMWQATDHLSGLWLGFLREHLAAIIAVFVLLPLTLFLNWKLGLLLVGFMLVFAIVNTSVVRHTQDAQAKIEQFHSRLGERATDALGNVSLIQSFVRLRAESTALRETMDALLRAQFPVLNWWAAVVVLTRASATFTTIGIFLLGTWLHLNGEVTVGEIVSFMGFAGMLIGRLDQVSGFISRLFFMRPSLEEFFTVTDARSAVQESPHARPFGTVRGEVRFEHVSLSHAGRPAVSDLTFDVPAGTTIALVGHTGSGKSTTVSLLMRQWDPHEGRIFIDGVDVRDATLESLRNNIGIVFQDNTMFYRSIMDNLRVGRPEASDAEVIAAAKLAEAHDFIMSKPQGYETLIGERGVTLSGGERQRLAIARALLKNPPILILDEATSALDAATEARVQSALAQLMKNRTTFIIAHRLSTVREADKIVVLDKGRIAEQGTFDELVAAQGVFAGLVATQLGRQTLAAAASVQQGLAPQLQARMGPASEGDVESLAGLLGSSS